MLSRIQKSKPLQILLLTVVGAMIAILVEVSGLATSVELKTLDWRFQQASHPEDADTSIIMVAIDQNSLEAFADRNVQWPWPREVYGVVLDYLRAAGAEVVAFDIEFSRRDFDRRETDGVVSDSMFADAVARNGSVVLATYLSTRERGDQAGSKILPRHLAKGRFSSIAVPTFTRATAPLPELQQAARHLAITNFESDADEIARRVPLVYRFQNGFIPYFGLACYLVDRHIPFSALDSLASTIPVGHDGRFLLYYYGRGGTEGVFRYYPFAALMSSALAVQSGGTPILATSVFRGKKVIIGGTAPGLLDFKPTPFTSFEPYPGMEIHATMLSNLLNRHFLRESPPWLAFLLIFVLSSLSAMSLFLSRRLPAALGIFAIIAAVFLGLAFLLFAVSRLWLPIVSPGIALLATFLGAALFSYATEGRQKRELRRAFNRYLSPTVVGEILANPKALELGGKMAVGTVYFSDIKDFTTIAESMQPKELVRNLNEYLSVATDLILNREAFLDKYIGDAVMAIFGAPIIKQDHATLACLTALEIQRTLEELYRRKPAGAPRFTTRIGLHSGKMILGNIGSTKRVDYTAIGDTVNLASRLEGVNKVFGTRIMISETVYQQARDAIAVRELDLIRVKGRNVPIRIYELIGEEGSLNEQQREYYALFAEALQLYRKQMWEPARRQFENLLGLKPDDGACRTYTERCALLSLQRFPADWDGVFTMTTK